MKSRVKSRLEWLRAKVAELKNNAIQSAVNRAMGAPPKSWMGKAPQPMQQKPATPKPKGGASAYDKATKIGMPKMPPQRVSTAKLQPRGTQAAKAAQAAQIAQQDAAAQKKKTQLGMKSRSLVQPKPKPQAPTNVVPIRGRGGKKAEGAEQQGPTKAPKRRGAGLPKDGQVMQGKRGGKYVIHNGKKYYVK